MADVFYSNYARQGKGVEFCPDWKRGRDSDDGRDIAFPPQGGMGVSGRPLPPPAMNEKLPARVASCKRR